MSPMGITSRNVNGALPVAVEVFKRGMNVRRIAPRDPSKTTLEYMAPIATTYLRPQERVLFHPARDANPFFHLFESLWILAARQDVSWLSFFLARIADFSDDGATFHGAYGHRMRNAFKAYDQVKAAMDELHRDRNSRRAVVAMWQPEQDSGYTGKDMPCNTTIFFKLREGALNMTVNCRSNDMVLGAYGANVVQFSMLQEYMASMLDAEIGAYTQWSDSFHVYEQDPAWLRCRAAGYALDMDPYQDGNVAAVYGFREQRPVKPYRIMAVPGMWDLNLTQFMTLTEDHMVGARYIDDCPDYANPFFQLVCVPLFNAYIAHKKHDYETAIKWAMMCAAEDWSLAGAMWLFRRAQKQAAGFGNGETTSVN